MANNSNDKNMNREGSSGSSSSQSRGGSDSSSSNQSRGSNSNGGGGQSNNPGNFANDRERAREAGRKGGSA